LRNKITIDPQTQEEYYYENMDIFTINGLKIVPPGIFEGGF